MTSDMHPSSLRAISSAAAVLGVLMLGLPAAIASADASPQNLAAADAGLAVSESADGAVLSSSAPNIEAARTSQPQRSAQAALKQTPELGYLLAPRIFRAAAEAVRPSMVTIETFGGVAASARGTRTPGQRGRRQRGNVGLSKPGEGPTTGVIVSEDGYIITSTYNFIRKPSVITVTLHDDSQYVATLLGRDETRKLCLLKIDTTRTLTPAPILPRSTVRVGQWAVSIGVGYGGDEPAISTGVISAESRIFGKAVQTDANISPANYGGPLVDIRGRVIGICVPLSPRSTGEAAGVEWYDSGIGFAVPLDGLDALIERMKANETIQHGKMGVAVQPAPNSVGVRDVADGSPAQQAGVQKGDRIIAINGRPVTDLADLQLIMGGFVAGERVQITVKRGEETIDFEIELAAGIEEAGNQGRPNIIRRPGNDDGDDGDQPSDGDAPAEGDDAEKQDADVPPADGADDAHGGDGADDADDAEADPREAPIPDAQLPTPDAE